MPKPTAALAPHTTPRGVGGIPLLGSFVATWRLLNDPKAPFFAKLFIVATVLYVVMPVDAIPEVIAPFIGWLDDAGVLIAARLVLSRQLNKYRAPRDERIEARVIR